MSWRIAFSTSTCNRNFGLDASRFFFFFSSRRRHTRCSRDWSSDVCSSDLMIGREELELMKPTAIIVNTSRGPVIDEVALHAHLAAGKIFGAGLDVFDQERSEERRVGKECRSRWSPYH